MAECVTKEPGVNRSVRAPLSVWEALGRAAAVAGLSRNRYASERLREAAEADLAEALRRDRAELERERLRAAGQGIYGV